VTELVRYECYAFIIGSLINASRLKQGRMGNSKVGAGCVPAHGK
jgi:hypothetical protein